MEQYGNTTTYNLETVVKQNIINSDYYRNDCLKLSTWSEVVDQIFYQVDYVEPWLAGNARGPSTAFCLLHRLFTLKPTEEEIQETIDHQDSVYIRAVGFLYLRYVCDPRKLWQWLGPYCNDSEEIQPSGPNGPAVTVGDFVRDVLLEQYYFETIFPRIPKKAEDEIQAGLRGMGLPTRGKGNGGCGGPDRRGGDDGNRRPASVKASLSVAFGQRAPNRAGTKDSARLRGAEAAITGRERDGGGSHHSRSRSRSLSREVRRNGNRHRTPERHQQRDRDREPAAERDRPREYDDRRGYDRERGRDYRGSDADGDRYRNRGGGYDSRSDRTGYDSRDRDRAYSSRDRDRGFDRDRERTDRADRYLSSRSRSRSQSRSRPEGRDARDVFKERAGGDSAVAVDIKSRYGDASGKLEFGPSGGSSRRTADEVFRIGGRRY